jgi:hypothetical protein
MKNLEELISNLSYNINVLDSLFLKLDSKYIRIKKYVSIINKIYLKKVDEWYFNNKSENKYFNITKK